MARFKSIAQRSPSQSGLEFKILSLLLDAVMLWIVTSAELDHCERAGTGLPKHFSFGWLIALVLLYSYLSLNILLLKHGFLCLLEVPFIQKSSEHISRSQASPKCQQALKIIYDLITIVMCTCFIAGDNLSDAICIDFAPEGSCIERSSEPQKVNASCMAIMSQEALSENSTTLSKCDVSMCRKGSVGLLGISIVLNLALMYCGHSFKSSLKGLPKIGSSHGWLTKAFNLLSLMLLFDQSLSGLHESIFKRTRNGTLCTDDTHISGGVVYGISVALWIFFFAIHIIQYWVSNYNKKHTKSTILSYIFYHLILASILVLYCVFIFADTPWPWECFNADPKMKKAGLKGRSALLTISVAIILQLCFVYVLMSCMPSLKMHRKDHISVGSEFEQMFKSIAKQYDPIKVENAENLFVKSEGDETSASYTIFMTRDDDWISEIIAWISEFFDWISRCCCKTTNMNNPNQDELEMNERGEGQTSMTKSPKIVGAYVKIGANKQSTPEYVAEAKYLKKQPQRDAGDLQRQDGIVTLDSFPKDSVISGFISKDITLNLPQVLRDGTVIRESK